MMTALETVALYYDAWRNKRGDFSEVPLADDFEFTGPVASVDSAEGYRAMARGAGQAVTSFEVRRRDSATSRPSPARAKSANSSPASSRRSRRATSPASSRSSATTRC